MIAKPSCGGVRPPSFTPRSTRLISGIGTTRFWPPAESVTVAFVSTSFRTISRIGLPASFFVSGPFRPRDFSAFLSRSLMLLATSFVS